MAEPELRDETLIRRVAAVVDHAVRPYFRAETRGMENLPEGPALIVGNHNAGLLSPESFLFCAAAYGHRGLDAVPYALNGDLGPVSVPALQDLVDRLGIVRARPDTARSLLDRGAKVLVFPGGDLDSMRPYRDRNRIVFGGRLGYARLAIRAGVPIVPLVTAGAHETMIVLTDNRWLLRKTGLSRRLRLGTWPVALCLPWGLVVGPWLVYVPWPSRILQEVLPPIRFPRSGDDCARDEAYVRECASTIEAEMQRALTRLADERARRARTRT
jgi:1-acyl-sn-glycerol-3-phosphate acyltransferase